MSFDDSVHAILVDSNAARFARHNRHAEMRMLVEFPGEKEESPVRVGVLDFLDNSPDGGAVLKLLFNYTLHENAVRTLMQACEASFVLIAIVLLVTILGRLSIYGKRPIKYQTKLFHPETI